MYEERFQRVLLDETALFYEAEGERLMQVRKLQNRHWQASEDMRV